MGDNQHVRPWRNTLVGRRGVCKNAQQPRPSTSVCRKARWVGRSCKRPYGRDRRRRGTNTMTGTTSGLSPIKQQEYRSRALQFLTGLKFPATKEAILAHYTRKN